MSHESKDFESKQKSFCVLPWVHLATHPHGGTSLCCRVDYTDGIGMSFNRNLENRDFLNLNSKSIHTLTNSESFKEARLKILAGEWPKACLGCKKEEDAGVTSKRLRDQKLFDFSYSDAVQKTFIDGSIAPDFQYVELRLGNLCNLKCRTCNPNSSSKWAHDYNILQKKLKFIRHYDSDTQFSWAEDQNFWADLFSTSKNVKELFINGGEPTLIKLHWVYLEKLIEADLAKNISIKYNINMTYLPPEAEIIWKKFKFVTIGASIDGLYKKNSYLRSGANWTQVENNLAKIKSWGIQVVIEPTVSIYNVFDLDELEKYAENLNIGFGLNFLYDPNFLAIENLPHQYKEKIREKLKSKLSDRCYQLVDAHLRAPGKPELWNQFIEYTNELDKMRSEKFQEIFFDYVNDLEMKEFKSAF